MFVLKNMKQLTFRIEYKPAKEKSKTRERNLQKIPRYSTREGDPAQLAEKISKIRSHIQSAPMDRGTLSNWRTSFKTFVLRRLFADEKQTFLRSTNNTLNVSDQQLTRSELTLLTWKAIRLRFLTFDTQMIGSFSPLAIGKLWQPSNHRWPSFLKTL